MKSWKHQSVLLKEAIEALNVEQGKIYVDATLGAAGHAKEIIRRGGEVIGFEIDSEIVNRLRAERIAGLQIVNENFVELEKVLSNLNIKEVSGIIFDLGVSTDQLESPKLGLSFRQEGPLDMRLSHKLGVTAADLVNALAEGELYELFRRYGEERFARHLARAVVRHRDQKKFETSLELANLIESEVPRRGKIHQATRIFMALRIAVNDELGNLEKGLTAATKSLKVGGRLVVISFHSLEDRVVKDLIRTESRLRIVTGKPIVPSEAEIKSNPRARSAKMRVAEKI